MERIRGVDAARGLAVLGMFAAHVGAPPAAGGRDWLAVADGRSAATFAVLAGVSLSLMSGGPEPVEGAELTLVRRRLVVRAVLIAALGYVLIALDTPIAVILPPYAVMFLLALPALGASRQALAAGGLAVLLLMPSVLVAWRAGPWPTIEVTDLLGTAYYPALAWVGYVGLGMAVGRSRLSERGPAARVLAAGAALAVLGYGAGLVGARLFPAAERYLDLVPHSNTTPEMIGNAGVALVVLGGCLFATRAAAGASALRPLIATGAMPLTVYTAQVVTVFLAGPAVVHEQRTNGTLLAFSLVTMVACTAWASFVGRGPLEELVRRATLAAFPRTTSPPVGSAH